ncbi:MAG: class I SAM-dependent methyltransferase [Chitinophagales bacterium]
MIDQADYSFNGDLAAAAFDKQAAVFDEIYSSNTIIQYKRDRVWKHLMERIRPGSRILELNAGTGEDAIYLASMGHRVHATDISQAMLTRLEDKRRKAGLDDLISSERCSFSELAKLHNPGPYDLIFSNFAGLNCSPKLADVIHQFKPLLKPGGLVTLVVMPPFCLWEILLVFRGKFKTAFRRLFAQKGRLAHIEGEYFRCWYYHPHFLIKHLKKEFDLESLEGLCSLVPPSYLENFAEKHAKFYRFLENSERRLKGSWPWKNIGDYFIITLRKRI